MKHKIRMPHNSTVDRPEIPVCSVNAVDELGKNTYTLFRTAAGQLYVMDKENIPVRVPEHEFNNFCRIKYNKK